MYFSHNAFTTFGDDITRVIGVINQYPVITYWNIESEEVADEEVPVEE